MVPVGVTEIAMLESGLKMTGPADALKLAQILEVDVVVVGAVTEYDPYYPPRIGLQVEWLSPHPWAFQPGVQTDPTARKRLIKNIGDQHRVQYPAKKLRGKRYGRTLMLRGQSPDLAKTSANAAVELPVSGSQTNESPVLGVPFGAWKRSSHRLENTSPPQYPVKNGVRRHLPQSQREIESYGSESVSNVKMFIGHRSKHPIPAHNISRSEDQRVLADTAAQELPGSRRPETSPLPYFGNDMPQESETPELTLPMLKLGPDPEVKTRPNQRYLPMDVNSALQPLMSYSRIFDGADANLTAELRDYVELNGDLRSGGWEAYLQRSEDFIRFACHQMIAEMLTLHGGEGKRRVVFKWRKHK